MIEDHEVPVVKGQLLMLGGQRTSPSDKVGKPNAFRLGVSSAKSSYSAQSMHPVAKCGGCVNVRHMPSQTRADLIRLNTTLHGKAAFLDELQ